MDKQELMQLIEDELNPNIKRIYMNHLRLMEDEVPVCGACSLYEVITIDEPEIEVKEEDNG